MAEEFTVAAVNFTGEKDNPHGGKLYKFKVRLRQETGESGGKPFTDDVYWQRKSRELEVGEKFYGHIEQGEYGPRFKTDQRPDGNFRAAHGSDVPTGERSRRIERQHSQEMGIRWADLVMREADEDETLNLEQLRSLIDWFQQDLDADVGSGQAAHGASDNHPPVAEDKGPVGIDVSAVSTPVGDFASSTSPPVEASPQLKGQLTQLFNKAGLSREAMKAVVLFRCGSEKATKQGAQQLITDLQEGATHDALLAEVWDAKRAGNPLGARAAALIPAEVPWDDDGSLPEAKVAE